MSSINEKGHGRNVALLGKIKEEAEGYGPVYDPSSPMITTLAITNRRDEAKAKLEEIGLAESLYTLAIDVRQTVIDKIEHLCPRIVSEAIACGADEKVIEDIYSITRLIQGRRAKVLPKTEAEITESLKAPESDPAPKVRRSAAHGSVDNKIKNFHKLISLISNVGEYHPNEAELNIINLTALLNAADTASNELYHASAKLENLRAERDKLLYHPKTGAIAMVRMIKNYVRALFGANSFQYKTLTALPFIRYSYRGL